MDIKMTDSVGYADILRIIFNDKCITELLESRRSLNFTFYEVMQIAKYNGYTNGIILLIAENQLNGTIYQYGNYGEFWVRHGETIGYA